MHQREAIGSNKHLILYRKLARVCHFYYYYYFLHLYVFATASPHLMAGQKRKRTGRVRYLDSDAPKHTTSLSVTGMSNKKIKDAALHKARIDGMSFFLYEPTLTFPNRTY